METYNPPAFPRRPNPKQSNLFSEMQYQIQLAYYRYEINTAQYVMSPGEKLAFNFIIFSFLFLFLSAIYYYLSHAIYLSARRLAYYLNGCITGNSRMQVARMSAPGMEVLMSTGGEAMRSLAEGGKVANASSRFAL
jgi:hypothetical protein